MNVYWLCFLCTFVKLYVQVSAFQYKPFPGKCPYNDVATVKDFNHKRFDGVWYPIESYMDEAEERSCVRHDLIWTDELNAYQFKTEENISGLIHTYKTLIVKSGFHEEAKFILHYEQDPSFWIIETDYDHYAIVWICKNGQSMTEHEGTVWILARKRTFSVESIRNIDSTLQNLQFNRGLLTTVHQRNCITFASTVRKTAFWYVVVIPVLFPLYI